jgi:Rad3-related DNA helicase
MYAKKLVLFTTSLLANSCTIDDKLLHSIDAKQSSHKLVIEGSYGTGTTTDLLCCKIEVLACMPGVEVN